MSDFDPIESLADMQHEFGEHGGVNMSIETSTTFTVMHADTLPEIFGGLKGPEDDGCFLYGRHFNPTVYVLGKQIAALEGAELDLRILEAPASCPACTEGFAIRFVWDSCPHCGHAPVTVEGGREFRVMEFEVDDV